MSLRFKVRRMEHRPERNEIQLTGTVPDGVLVTGMTARSTVDEGATFTGSVVEIEHFARAADDEGTRLTFQYDSEEEGARWRDVAWPGMEMRLDM